MACVLAVCLLYGVVNIGLSNWLIGLCALFLPQQPLTGSDSTLYWVLCTFRTLHTVWLLSLYEDSKTPTAGVKAQTGLPALQPLCLSTYFRYFIVSRLFALVWFLLIILSSQIASDFPILISSVSFLISTASGCSGLAWLSTRHWQYLSEAGQQSIKTAILRRLPWCSFFK